MVTFCLAWTTKRHARILHSAVAEHVKARLKSACIDGGWELRSLSLRLASVRLQVIVGPHDSAGHVVAALKRAASEGIFHAFPHLGVMRYLWTRSFFSASIGTVSDYHITEYIERERRGMKRARQQTTKKTKARTRPTKTTTLNDLGYRHNVISKKED